MNVLVIGFIVVISTTVNSDNGRYRAFVNYRRDAELTTESFILYDQNHEVIYTKHDLAVNTFLINNSGYVFALNEHYLYLYRPDGGEMLLRELKYPNGFGFSNDNSLFFASDWQGIFAFSSDGELIYTFKPGRLWASTGHGALIAIVSADSLFIYEKGVRMKAELLSSPYARDIRFLEEAKSIVVDIPGGVEMYDIEKGVWVEQK